MSKNRFANEQVPSAAPRAAPNERASDQKWSDDGRGGKGVIEAARSKCRNLTTNRNSAPFLGGNTLIRAYVLALLMVGLFGRTEGVM